jgi:hypothetical protein
MRRVAAFVPMWLLATLAVTVLAPVANAQLVAPPTLSGESFHEDVPTITSVTCFPDQPPFQIGGTFEARGTATGPYPGTFQETGEVSVTLDANGHVTDRNLTASFSIDSSVGRVTGTIHSTNFGSGCGPVNDPNANSLAFNTDPQGFAATDTYDANIFTASGAFADNGLFQVAFSPEIFDESFRSALTSPQQLFPTSKDQCMNGGWRDYGSTFKNQGQCIAFVEHS